MFRTGSLVEPKQGLEPRIRHLTVVGAAADYTPHCAVLYGVATMCRLPKLSGLFCERALPNDCSFPKRDLRMQGVYSQVTRDSVKRPRRLCALSLCLFQTTSMPRSSWHAFFNEAAKETNNENGKIWFVDLGGFKVLAKFIGGLKL